MIQKSWLLNPTARSYGCRNDQPEGENDDHPAKHPRQPERRLGLFGTMNDNAAAAWPIAMTAISDATYQPLESVRLFLDSRHGRHFADDVLNEMLRGHTIQQAIDAAVTRWMGWTIGRKTSRTTASQGLPYLTGFVIHCEVTDESFRSRSSVRGSPWPPSSPPHNSKPTTTSSSPN